MTSKKGAIEDTKKSHKYSQTRSRKKFLSYKVFQIVFWEEGRGARGFGTGRRRGVAGAPPATKGMRHPQHFVKIEVFSPDVFNFSRSSKIEVNHCYQIELKALSDTRV